MSQARSNSLQAALAGAASEAPAKAPAALKKKKTAAGQGRAASSGTAAKKPATPAPAKDKPASSGRYRDSTVMVGGHFPPHVLRQLRMIAAEEDTTNQALIADALDLLFMRKGKQKIADLAEG